MGDELLTVKPENKAITMDVPTTAETFELVQRMAKLFAASTLVPTSFQNNIPNCYIALNMSIRMKADPMMVMQNLYVVHGNPAWSSKFLIATFNSCGRFSSIRYVWEGEKGKDSYGCHAEATELATGNVLSGSTVTMEIAKKEGWIDKNGSKWRTMPEQMLMYRSASWFVRAYAPEISMGLQTQEEMEDVHDLRRNRDGSYTIIDNEPKLEDRSGTPKLAALIPKPKNQDSALPPIEPEQEPEHEKPKRGRKPKEPEPESEETSDDLISMELSNDLARATSLSDVTAVFSDAQFEYQSGNLSKKDFDLISALCDAKKKEIQK